MKKIAFIILILVSYSKSVCQCFQNISSGDNYTLAVKNDGTLWAWGSNNCDKLGPSSTFVSYTNIPKQAGIQNDWMKAATAYFHSMVIKNTGGLHGWGCNTQGQVGIGIGQVVTTIPFSAQVGNDTWMSVSGGYQYTLAVNTNGLLFAWGVNTAGRLGDGTTIQRSTPVQIGNSQWQKIAAGFGNSYGIQSDGTLWTWGFNVGTIPTQVGTDNNWAEVTNKTALKSDGTLWNISATTLTQIGTENDWSSVTRNFFGNHTLALKTDGTLWAWGQNGYGQLGDGTTTDKAAPIQIGSSTDWESVTSGENFSVALNSAGQLWTWGANYFGQLGDGTFTSKSMPTLINCPLLNNVEFELNKVEIYPNPVHDILTIQVSNDNITIDKVMILDFTGKVICEKMDANILEIDLQNLQTGMYFISIYSGENSIVKKFIKQ